MSEKVLLATGNHDLDRELGGALSAAGIATAGPVYYKEALQLETVLDGVEVVVISPALGGSAPIDETIFSLRKNDIRVILLAGEGNDELREAAIGMGVYDIIEDPVRAADVVESVLHPATFASAVGCKTPDSSTGRMDAGKSKTTDRAEVMVEDEPGESLSWETEDELDKEQGREWIEEQPPKDGTDEYVENRELSGEDGKEPEHRAKGEPVAKKDIPFRARKAVPEKSNMCYMPHHLVAIWSPSGFAKSFTAFNLSTLAASKGFDAALINYDLQCPDLDVYFNIRQTGLKDFDENSAGVMTFADGFRPELAARFLRKRAWGIQYLPAGSKLGNIGTPDIDVEDLEKTLRIVYSRNVRGKPAITVVDAGRCFEYAPTLAALQMAAVVLVPTDGSPVFAEVIKQQMEELDRLGHSPRFIELLFATPGRKAFHFYQERVSVAFDWNTYLVDSAAMRPQCLREDGRRAWEGVLNQLAPPNVGNVFRRL